MDGGKLRWRLHLVDALPPDIASKERAELV